MPWERAWNFRATATYRDDRPPETYSLGAAYPEARNGLTFGWDSNRAGSTRDRSTTVDRRLAGILFTPNSTANGAVFRVDLPSPGLYDLRCALGDATSLQSYQYMQVTDAGSGAVLLTVDAGGVSPIGQFFDATVTLLSAAEWPGANRPARILCPGRAIKVRLGAPLGVGASNASIAHLSLRRVERHRAHQLAAVVAAAGGAGGASYSDSVSLGATSGLALAGPLSIGAALPLPSASGYAAAAGLGAAPGVALDAAAALAADAGNSVAAALPLGASSGYAAAGVGSFPASVALGSASAFAAAASVGVGPSLALPATSGYAGAAGLGASGSVAMGASPAFAPSSTASLGASLALHATPAFDPSLGGAVYSLSVGLAASAGLAQSAGLAAVGSIGPSASPAFAPAATAALGASLALPAASSIDLSLGGASYSLSVGLSATAGLAQAAGIDAVGAVGMGATAAFGAGSVAAFVGPVPLAAAAGFAPASVADQSVAVAFAASSSIALAAPSAVTATSLLQAIQSYWDGDSGLSSSVGTLYAGRARAGKAPPFARVNLVGGTTRYTMAKDQIETYYVQVSVFAATERDADEFMETVDAALNFAPASALQWQRGYLMNFRRTGPWRVIAEPGLGVADPANWQQAPQVYHALSTYHVKAGRARP